jgi:hypothetical protein
MRTLSITSENGSALAISRTFPYVLNYLLGSNAPSSEAENRKSPYQNGVTHINTTLNARELIVGVTLCATDMISVQQARAALANALNPEYRLTLLYDYAGGTKKITGYLSSPVEFEEEGKNAQVGEFTIECDNPYWTDEEQSSARLAISVPTFHFPLAFPPTITFSVIVNRIVTIDNNGHTQTPVNIKFFGPSTNPIITNVTTGLFIKVNRTLLDGEVLEINTYGDDKYVRIDGVNAFGSIDLDSSLSFSLIPGENEITYDADSGAESAEVLITYDKRYVGV